MNLKKTTDEMKNVNDNILNELEQKNKQLKQYEKEINSKQRNFQDKDRHNMETLKRENSILATQLRDMQDELAENSNISKIQTKNASSLEISNNVLSER